MSRKKVITTGLTSDEDVDFDFSHKEGKDRIRLIIGNTDIYDFDKKEFLIKMDAFLSKVGDTISSDELPNPEGASNPINT